MPTKFDPEVWKDVRSRMSRLLTKGMEPRVAAEQVSMDLQGKPAAGTIYNKYREGWKVPVRTDLSELRAAVSELKERVDALQATVRGFDGDGVSELREDKARAEGMAEALKEVVLIAETGHNGHGANGI